jgi:hypothetical protein
MSTVLMSHWKAIVYFVLVVMWAGPAFMLGYVVRGNVDSMGGEIKVIRDWWKRKRK